MPSTSLAPPDRILSFAKRAQKINNCTFIKFGTRHEIQREVNTIFFIRRNTSIPALFVSKSQVQESGSWFSIHLIPGLPLTNS